MPQTAMAEAVGRLELMTKPDEKWDLSPNDRRDIRLVLDRYKASERENEQLRNHLNDALVDLRRLTGVGGTILNAIRELEKDTQ